MFYPRTLLTRRIPRCSEPPSQCGAVYTPTLTKEAPLHRNAPLTPEGRRRLCELIDDGWTIAAAAESMRISRQTAHKWWRRYQAGGGLALEDCSSRPRRCPTKTPAKVERRVSSSVVVTR